MSHRSTIRGRISRWLIVCTFVVCFAKLAKGQDVAVRGYYRADGQWVAAHMRSQPDGVFSNNWTTKGNQNPYTGKWGTRVTPPGRTGGAAYPQFGEIDHARNLSLWSNGHSSVVGGYGEQDAVTKWRATPPRFAPAARLQAGSGEPAIAAWELDAGLAPEPQVSADDRWLKAQGVVVRPVTEREALDWGAPNGKVIENPFVKPK
jgi:hypothetical protein